MKKEEISIAKWHVEKMKESRKYFEYADLSQNILEQQKEDDLLLLQDWLITLESKLNKDDSRKAELVYLIKSLWRIQSYCGGLETICKSSTVIVMNHIKRIDELESENKILRYQNIQDKAKYDSEVSNLKKQIDWTDKINKT